MSIRQRSLLTYSTRLALCRQDSQYPEAWEGLIGAWIPSFGVTGAILRDLSGFGHHGFFTNASGSNPIWTFGNPRLGWRIGGGASGNSYVSLGNPTPDALRPSYITIIGHAAILAGYSALISCAWSTDSTAATQGGWSLESGSTNNDYYTWKVAVADRTAGWGIDQHLSNGQFSSRGHEALLVARYDGKTQVLSGYSVSDGILVATGSNARSPGGPIYYGADNGIKLGRRDFYGGWTGGLGNGSFVGNVLVYNHDIGPDLSQKIALSGFQACPLPFIPFQRRFFPVPVFNDATTDSVTLADEVDSLRICTGDMQDSVGLADETSNAGIYGLTSSDALDVEDELTLTGTYGLGSNDALALDETLAYTAQYGLTTADSLSLDDSIVSPATRSLVAGDTLTFVDGLSRTFDLALVDSVTIEDRLAAFTVCRVDDTLMLSEAWSSIRARSFAFGDSLVLSESEALFQCHATVVGDVVELAEDLEFVGPRSFNLADSVVFSDATYPCKTYPKVFSDTLHLQESFVSSEHCVSFSDTFHFVDVLDNGIRYRALTDSLSLRDEFAAPIWPDCSERLQLVDSFLFGQITVAVSDRMVLTDSIRSKQPVGLVAETLALADAFGSNIRVVSVQETITFVETMYVPAMYIASVADTLTTTETSFDVGSLSVVTTTTGLVDTYAVAKTTRRPGSDSLAVRDAFAVSKIIASAVAVGFEDSVSLTDELHRNQIGAWSDFVPLADEFGYELGTPVFDLLDLEEDFAVAHIGAFGVVDSLALSDGYAFWTTVAGLERQYHPFTSPGAAATPAPSLSPQSTSGVRFQLVSLSDPTDEVTLRAPDFGNKDRLGFNRVLRETRGGTLVVFADPQWPKTQTLALNFSGLSRDQAQSLLTFLGNHLGQEVGMTDWEGRNWTGVVMNPDSPIIEDSRGRFAASFQFEGSPA